MAQTITYHNITVKSVPHRLYNDEWRPKIILIWMESGSTAIRHIAPLGTCATEKEADLRGIRYGQSIIDGQVPGVTVT
ncbi:hypothetical protein W02_10780 [Nitrospira sp. KM1]|uniref:hypothetical protein n=1 Tax=Nitrospira sp. KM1 TaxID=1936990 RepID=UPI0013A721B4|nr:hypothetical protein [Nitrospira sp. KM1]BCA53938.1 hypothetical protein W02_10780 [Nitrospira sp. KM1]